MSTKEKLIERFKRQPKDFTWDELVRLFGIFDFTPDSKGKTIEIIMQRLEYKGYYGSIEYSEGDDCLFGKVLGMPDNLISYEGNTAAELYSDFKEAIDAYLDYCQRSERKPRKGFNGVLNILISPEVHSRMAIYAQNSGTSIDAFINDSIERRLETVH